MMIWKVLAASFLFVSMSALLHAQGHPSADAIDLSTAAVYNSPPDIASWPITTNITQLHMRPTAPSTGVSLVFPAQQTWPECAPPGWTDGIEYTVWAVLKISGQWRTSGFIQMWRGRESTGAPILAEWFNWAYDARWGPMNGYLPSIGEQMGFFVSSGSARGEHGVSCLRERSNVVVVNLPAGDLGDFSFSVFSLRAPRVWIVH